MNNLAKIEICAVILSRVIQKSVLSKFTELCMEQKHLSLSSAIDEMILL